ncbi:Fatty acid hydroxylase family (carotene hydroxylase/sterol desaturase) [hydrothermal vent metagenome]|uniref:Fatty acid hydroxylase family (Carotene hydroxylase/sterol desaturase) n=1 Tax=hydrothermal vent metagenome TaxID=652676 RepID=A0A3B1CZJ0_9ZZZZ
MLIVYESTIRLICFLSIFVVMALWEVFAPRRPLASAKTKRWFTNISIVVINTFVLRGIFSVAAVGTALIAQEEKWGLVNHWHWPAWFALPFAVITLDFIIYLQHVMFHAVPVLWRLHMVHHADLDLDVTSGSRFHPIEIILSMGIKLASVVLIGAPPEAVVMFEILLNMTAMFNHSNVQIPKKLDTLLRYFIVTPDMHLIHHSVLYEETNRNFGFNLPWWDRLMGTYRPEPKEGYLGLSIGLDQFRDPKGLTLPKILLLPFTGRTGGYSFTQDKD